ncbi:FG-GAP repeat domain-containing protein [Streptacidiphilus sp. MAP12-33]|uniref:FG-GAP repeat domain-containing protein n=1 Tax=Streptacidiphilus sp. MAP12-33 TaxID=3156266 RepID=UPI0035138AB7
MTATAAVLAAASVSAQAAPAASRTAPPPTATAVLADKYVKDTTPPPRRVWRTVALSVPKGSHIAGYCYVLDGTLGVPQVGRPCDNSWVAAGADGSARINVRPLQSPFNDLTVVAVGADGQPSQVSTDLRIQTAWGPVDKLGDITGDGKTDLLSRLGTVMRHDAGKGNGRLGQTRWARVDVSTTLYARVGIVDGSANNGLLALANGRIMSLGGDGIGDFGPESCCLYSPDGNDWSNVTQLTGAMNVAGKGTAGFVVVRGGQIQYYGATEFSVRPAVTLGVADKNTQLVGVQDFSGDGKPDLLVRDGKVLKLYAGNGDGTFKAPVVFAKGYDVSNLVDITSDGDANGDGKADLWATTTTGGLVFIPGLGKKGFGKPLLLARTGWKGVQLY